MPISKRWAAIRAGRPVVKSCVVLAVSPEGRRITTIEGTDDLAAIEAAFVVENGFRCGYCTTGTVLTAAELLRHNPRPGEVEIRRAINGNLCHCNGYDAIVSAIHRAARDPATASYYFIRCLSNINFM